jgi:hypothetical protein
LSGYSLAWHNKSKHSNVMIDSGEQANVIDYGIDTENISVNLLASKDLPDVDNFSKGHFLTNETGVIDFGNECSNTFFHHEFMSEMPGGGASALVKRSLTGSELTFCQVHPSEVSFHMFASKFVHDLS